MNNLVIHLEKIDAFIQKIVSACFPDYKGKQIKLSSNVPSEIRSYWDGGSRYFFAFYQLDTGKVLDVHNNHPFYEPNQPSKLKELPVNIALVQHTIFQGKDLGITIYLNPANMTPYLEQIPEAIPLTALVVLMATKSYKSAFRFEEARRYFKVTKEQFDAAKQELAGRGLMDRRGAITPAGRNYLERCPYMDLRDLYDKVVRQRKGLEGIE